MVLGYLLGLGAACVDLTPPWNQRLDAAGPSGPPSSGTGGTLELGGEGEAVVGAGGVGGFAGDAGPAVPDGALDVAMVDGRAIVDSGALDSSDLPSADSGDLRPDAVLDVPAAGGASGDAGRSDLGAGGRAGTGGSRGQGGSGGRGGSSGSGGVVGKGGSSGGGGTSAMDAGVCTGHVGLDAGSGLDAGLSRELIAYYSCDQVSGVTLGDGSGDGKDAALYGSGYGPGAGKIGGALKLSGSGSSYAALPTGFLSAACEATIASWVYVNPPPDAGPLYWARIWDFGRDTSVYMFLTPTNTVSGNLRFAITVAGNVVGKEQILDGTAPLPTGKWTHVAVVLGPDGGALYVDGAKVVSSLAVTLRPADLGITTNNYIGRSEFSQDSYFDGAIDDFRVYGRALSPDEIKALVDFAN
jgi:hypothetical protein